MSQAKHYNKCLQEQDISITYFFNLTRVFFNYRNNLLQKHNKKPYVVKIKHHKAKLNKEIASPNYNKIKLK